MVWVDSSWSAWGFRVGRLVVAVAASQQTWTGDLCIVSAHFSISHLRSLRVRAPLQARQNCKSVFVAGQVLQRQFPVSARRARPVAALRIFGQHITTKRNSTGAVFLLGFTAFLVLVLLGVRYFHRSPLPLHAGWTKARVRESGGVVCFLKSQSSTAFPHEEVSCPSVSNRSPRIRGRVRAKSECSGATTAGIAAGHLGMDTSFWEWA